jgi:hypothetical protein
LSYPEHEKLKAIHEQSQWLGGFLDWLTSTKGYRIAKYFRYYKGSMEPIPEDTHPDDEDVFSSFMPVSLDINGILADYFDIDLKKIEQEKRAMLDEIRKMNKRKA